MTKYISSTLFAVIIIALSLQVKAQSTNEIVGKWMFAEVENEANFDKKTLEMTKALFGDLQFFLDKSKHFKGVLLGKEDQGKWALTANPKKLQLKGDQSGTVEFEIKNFETGILKLLVGQHIFIFRLAKPSTDDLIFSKKFNLEEPQEDINYEKAGIAEASIQKIGLLKVGDPAPDFTTKDQNGDPVSLNQLTKNGDLIIVFYRGYWCGYCTKYLGEYQKELSSLKAKGINVIAISPEGGEGIKSTLEQTNLEIPVIRDADASIMNAYGVAFEVNQSYQDKIIKYKKKSLEEINDSEEALLPIPATFIIGKNGRIKWMHFDPDYSKRADISEVINQL